MLVSPRRDLGFDYRDEAEVFQLKTNVAQQNAELNGIELAMCSLTLDGAADTSNTRAWAGVRCHWRNKLWRFLHPHKSPAPRIFSIVITSAALSISYSLFLAQINHNALQIYNCSRGCHGRFRRRSSRQQDVSLWPQLWSNMSRVPFRKLYVLLPSQHIECILTLSKAARNTDIAAPPKTTAQRDVTTNTAPATHHLYLPRRPSHRAPSSRPPERQRPLPRLLR